MKKDTVNAQLEEKAEIHEWEVWTVQRDSLHFPARHSQCFLLSYRNQRAESDRQAGKSPTCQ